MAGAAIWNSGSNGRHDDMKFNAIIAAILLITCACFGAAALPVDKIGAEMGAHYDEIFGGDSAAAILNDTVMVKGRGLGGAEEGLFLAMQSAYPQMREVRQADDNAISGALEMNYPRILLIGGPEQNSLSEYYLGNASLGWETLSKNNEQVVIERAYLAPGRQVVMLSLRRGFDNYAKQNVGTSPLKGLIDDRLIPVAATAVAVGGLALLPHLMKILRSVIGKCITAKYGKEGKRFSDGWPVLEAFGFHVRSFDLLSVLLAAAIFGAGFAWTFAAGKDNLLKMIGLNIVIAAMLYYGQSILRIIVARLQNVKTEYQFWAEGAFLTLLSAYLGNMVGSVGYFLEEERKKQHGGKAKDEKPDIAERERIRKAARLRLAIILVTASFGFLFFIANIIHPNKALQLFAAFCVLNAATDLLPIAPLPGAVLKKWRWYVYVPLALLTWGLYIAMSIV